MRLPRWTWKIAPFAAAAVAVGVRVADPAPMPDLRLAAFDLMQTAEPREYESAPVAVVDIDDEALAEYGQWPWPRTLMADLVGGLHEAGAAAVALDMVFAEPDRTSPDRVADAWRRSPRLKPGADAIGELDLPSTDKTLADAFRKGRTVAGFALAAEGAPPDKAWGGMVSVGDNPKPFLPAFDGAVENLDALTEAATGAGAMNVSPDRDGVVRRVPLLFRSGERIVPSLALEALRAGQGASSHVAKTSDGGFGRATGLQSVKTGGAVLPVDANGHVWLHFTGAVPERTVSAARVLDGRADDFLRGKIVFVGASATGLQDLHPMPLGEKAPGVTFHAQVAESATTGSFLRRPDWANGAEALAAGALVLALYLAMSARRFGPLACAASTAGVAAAPFGGAWWAFAERSLLLDPVFPAGVGFAAAAAATLGRHAASEGERRRVRNAFRHYLSPVMVEKLAEDPDSLARTTERRELTVMFCDIRGFTGLSENMEAERVAEVLNSCLTPMTEAVMSRGGTVDKYIGDAMMAFWNAPLDDPLHASNAVEAALDMLERLDRAPEALESGVRIGIGLNTGPASVGNMGSEQRFDYTAIGDSVNVASRVESACKTFAVDLAATEATVNAAPDCAWLKLGDLSVKGRERPVSVHTAVGGPEVAASPEFAELADLHAEVMSAGGDGTVADAARRAARHPLATRLRSYYARLAPEHS